MKVQIGKQQTRARQLKARPLGVGAVMPSGGVILRLTLEDESERKVWLEFEPSDCLDGTVIDSLINRLTVMRDAVKARKGDMS